MSRPRTVAIDLETPLTVAGETVTRLTLRRPLAGELRGVEISALIRMEADAVLSFLPQICQPNVTTGDLEQMDAFDFGEVAGTLASFFLRSGRASAEASPTPSNAS